MGWSTSGKGGKGGKGKGAAVAALTNGSAKGGAASKAEEAIKEIIAQLTRPASTGKVWVEGWGWRFQDSLGTLREFLESRKDKFKVIPEEGTKYSIQLKGPAGKSAGKAGAQAGGSRSFPWQGTPGGGKAGGGGGGLATSAVKEVKEQLQQPGNDGRVWVRDWKSKYEGTLGSLREFLEGRSEFLVVPGEGRKFTVELKGQQGGGGGWNNSSGGWGGGWGRSSGWKKGGGQGQGGWDPCVAAAIREIKDQLTAHGNKGNVWIWKWGERFQEQLGTLREFLESRPDKFTVIPGEGRKFTVEVAGKSQDTPDEDAGEPPKKKFKPANDTGKKAGLMALLAPIKDEAGEEEGEGSYEELSEQAIAEVKAQLQKPGNDGRVWIRNWKGRFEDVLGPQRDFLDTRPDEFEVVPGEGNKYTVKLSELSLL